MTNHLGSILVLQHLGYLQGVWGSIMDICGIMEVHTLSQKTSLEVTVAIYTQHNEFDITLPKYMISCTHLKSGGLYYSHIWDEKPCYYKTCDHNKKPNTCDTVPLVLVRLYHAEMSGCLMAYIINTYDICSFV